MKRLFVFFLLLSVAIGCAASKPATILMSAGSLDALVKRWGDPDDVLVEDGNMHYYWSSVTIKAVISHLGEPEVTVTEKAYRLYIFDGGIVFSDSPDVSGVIYIRKKR